MLSIWCNTRFPEETLTQLREGIKPHRFIFPRETSASTIAGAGPDPALDLTDIAFGQPDPASVMQSSRLRWVHLTSAGYSRYDTKEFRDAVSARGIVVTNSSHVYAEPCAEHALAFMLTHARALGQAHDMQRTARSWDTLPLRAGSSLLLGQSVVFLGFGAIGRRLAQLLSPFSVQLSAHRRRSDGNEGVPIILGERLEEALAGAAHVVNLLPDNMDTRHFVDARMFAAMKPQAVFYNIGRGTTVDQEALLACLRSGHLAGAYLDVTDPEPLPASHPLWAEPRCFITPHTAGGFDTEYESLARHFLENLARYLSGSALAGRIM